MKNLLYIISLCGLLTACDLQEEPYGFYSDDNFYKSETDAESGLLYAYNALTFLEYSRGIFYIGDIPTETMSPKSDEAGDVYQLRTGSRTARPSSCNTISNTATSRSTEPIR